MKSLRSLCVLLFILPVLTHAAKDADLKPVLAKPGPATVDDAFGTPELPKAYTVNKGDISIKEGALTLAYKEADHHPAVLLLGVPNHNSIIKFSFKMEDAKGFNLSYNSAKGHLFRILVDGEGLTVMKDGEKDKAAKKAKAGAAKGKAKAAPTTTAAPAAAEKKPLAKSEKLANAAGKISSGEWHTMLVEVQGAKVTIQTDTGLKAEATHPELDVDKTGYRFVTGSSLSLDDVKAWSAE